MDKLSEIVKLSKKFISIKSISGNPKGLDEILELALSYLKEFTVEGFSKKGIKSALVYNTTKRPKKFNIILSGHLDVIPGKEHQYKPKLLGDKLYGVGSMDMKSNVACLIMVFKDVAKKVNYPLALQLVTDEQSGSLNGTKYQIEQGIKANFAITGETTNFKIINKAKGVLWLKISAKGETAHGAYPWQGNNAILQMIEFLNELTEKYPNPKEDTWQSTINISHIGTSNIAFNKIPGDCEIWLDVRFIPDEKTTILNQLKLLLPIRFSLEVVHEEPPLFVSKENDYVRTLQKSAAGILKHEVFFYGAHGTSDATYFAEVGCPAIEFGPEGKTGNTSKEYINVPSLKVYYQTLVKFLLDLNTIK